MVFTPAYARLFWTCYTRRPERPTQAVRGMMVLSPPHTPGRVLGQPPPQTGALHEDRPPPDGRGLPLLPLRSRVVAVTQADRVRAPAPPCTGHGSERSPSAIPDPLQPPSAKTCRRVLLSTPWTSRAPGSARLPGTPTGGCLGCGAHSLRLRTRGRLAPPRAGRAVAFAVVTLQVPVICRRLTTRLLNLTLAYQKLDFSLKQRNKTKKACVNPHTNKAYSPRRRPPAWRT